MQSVAMNKRRVIRDTSGVQMGSWLDRYCGKSKQTKQCTAFLMYKWDRVLGNKIMFAKNKHFSIWNNSFFFS